MSSTPVNNPIATQQPAATLTKRSFEKNAHPVIIEPIKTITEWFARTNPLLVQPSSFSDLQLEVYASENLGLSSNCLMILYTPLSTESTDDDDNLQQWPGRAAGQGTEQPETDPVCL